VLLFCNYKTFVVTTDNNSKKAQGGKRVMYTTHNPCWDAKNRFNLADELDLNYSSIAHLFEAQMGNTAATSATAEAERPAIVKLKKMIEDAGISEETLKEVVAARGHYAAEQPITDYSDDFIARWIIPNWKKIKDTITTKNGGKE
jgi:molecular chaperone DnaK (HSP70)